MIESLERAAVEVERRLRTVSRAPEEGSVEAECFA